VVLTVHRRYYVEIKSQLDATDEFFIADLIACSTCFRHHYAHHQELESIIQVAAACRIWCCKDVNCKFLVSSCCVFCIKCRVLYTLVMGHVGCRGLCVGVLGSFLCGVFVYVV
jgi:hypothetical protein